MAGRLKTGWVKIATSGATVDGSGRVIKKEWLTSMAAHYDIEVHAAKIEPDHNDWMPNGGRVLALKAEPATNPKLEGEVHLFGILQPSKWLIQRNREGQYCYASIDVGVDFMNGKYNFYLQRLGVTDNQASSGVDELQFSGKKHLKFSGDSIDVAKALESTVLDHLIDNLVDKFSFSKNDQQEDLDMTEQQMEALKASMSEQLKQAVSAQFGQLKTDLETHIDTKFSKLNPDKTPAPSPTPTPTPTETPAPSEGDESSEVEAPTKEQYNALENRLKTAEQTLTQYAAQRTPITPIPDGGEDDTDHSVFI